MCKAAKSQNTIAEIGISSVNLPMLVVGSKLIQSYLNTMARSSFSTCAQSPTRKPLCIAIKDPRDEGLKVR